MRKEINFSFIIPHKNCPGLLQRCVDSIPMRDDIQIIIVDDNSDEDKKPTVQREDVEIILLDAENAKGAGRARNIGLDRAKGEWLLFADADDFFSENLNFILDKYKNDEEKDLIILNAYTIDEENNTRPYKTEKLIRDYLEYKNKAEENLRYNIWTPWTRMVKRNFVISHNIYFDEIPAGNDVMFCLNCSKYAKIIDVEEKPVYYYFKPQNGSLSDKHRKTMLASRFELREKVFKLKKEVGYKPLPSFMDIVLFSVKNSIAPLENILSLYFSVLKNNNVYVITDIVRYVVLILKGHRY